MSAAPNLWPFGELRPLSYRVVLIDCPWNYQNWSKAGEHKSPKRYYRTMTTEELAALPVADLAQGDGVFVMWATAPLLPEAIDLMGRWHISYVTAGAWAKRSPTGRKWNMGTGYVLRSAAEFYILGHVGKPRTRSNSVRNLIEAPVRGHSVKPEKMYEDLEELYDGPYCELFARRRRPGWSAWGDQLEEDDSDEHARPGGGATEASTPAP